MISPDGRWVAYTSNESGKTEIYVQAFSGSGAKTLVSSNGGTAARWSRDGRELFFWSGVPPSSLNVVQITAGADLRAGPPREVFKFISGTTWDVTPDRNRFLVELTADANGADLAIVTNWFDELRRRAPVKK